MLAWLPSRDLQHGLGSIPGVDLEVVEDWRSGALPSSKDVVEVIVPPQTYAGDFAEIIRQTPKLRVVQTLSAGVNQYGECHAQGVRLYNASGVHVAATAEWVVAVILASQRELLAFNENRKTATWAQRPTRTLFGANVIIVGAGEIGRAVAQRLVPFGARVTMVARNGREGVTPIGGIGELLPAADVVVLLVPLTVETTGLVDSRFLASMQSGALLVNASRGAVVDSAALLGQLDQGRLRAAIDVFDSEPPPPDSGVWSAPGLLFTPHVASFVHGVLDRQIALLKRRLPEFTASGDPNRG